MCAVLADGVAKGCAIRISGVLLKHHYDEPDRATLTYSALFESIRFLLFRSSIPFLQIAWGTQRLKILDSS